jgi:YD repeat-containing protein
MINTGSSTATGCTIAPLTTVPAIFVFRTTDPTTNAVIGSTNTPVDIPGGKAQTFVFAFTPTATFPPTDVQLQFDCANTEPALAISGINTLLLSASSTPVPDIVALAATLSNNGVVTTDASTGSGVFAVAAVNVGSSDTLTVTADTGAVSLPLSVSLCATDLTTGVCVNPTTPSNRVTVAINTNATPSFGIFVASTGSIPLDPAVNRIFVRFASANGVTRGATSVAVRRGDSANAAPISNDGPDQNVPMGTMIILDGSGSSDANGDQLTFAWAFVSVPAGSAATLANPTSVHPTFTADVAGSYIVRLVVNDGQVGSTPDTVTITASTANTAPTISRTFTTTTDFAYDTLGRLIGATTTITVTASDPDGDPLTFTWSASNGSISFNGGTATWRRGISFGMVTGGTVTVTVSDGRGGMDTLRIIMN